MNLILHFGTLGRVGYEMINIKKTARVIIVLLASLWLVAFVALRFDTHAYARLSEEQLAEAAAYLEGKLTPAPSAWQWNTFTPEPDVDLRTGMIDAANAKGTVIVVPGFTATIEMTMREIVRINAAGYRVASIEYRGQGESYRPLSNPEKGFVESYAQLGEELAAFAEQVRIANKPLFFYSISQGAHITMRMAGEQSPNVSAYALIVPMIKVNSGNSDYATARTVANVLHTIGLGTVYFPGQSEWPKGELVFGKPIPCNANPDTAQTQSALFAERESLRTSGVTASWLHETASSTDALFRPEHIAAISQPVQMFTAGVDLLVDTPAAQQFCDSLARCELKHLAESRHCVTRENFELYDRVIEDAINHFDQHL
jgi:lysophospholipase